jgi:uncharacterized protein GlcG (DUF336 family)
MKTMTTRFATALVAVAIFFSTSAHALDQKPVLTLDMANQIVAACVALATAEEWRPVNVAVFDDGGNLKAFQRMDNAFLGSIQIAQMKGHTSTVFPFPTRLVAELAYGKDGEPGSLPGISEIPGIAAFPGGVPIMTGDGHQVGGVGVSGATGDQDEQCAQTGIAAIAGMLN